MYEYEYRPLLFLLIGELSFLAFFFLIFFLKRIYCFFLRDNLKKRKEEISDFIINSFKNEGILDVSKTPKAVQNSLDLLTTLEAFDLRFKEESWDRLKESLATYFLLPQARKWCKSVLWKKRSFAARCFVLLPLKQDEKLLISLMRDSHFLVQSHAALALIALESPLGIKEVVKNMSEHLGFVRCFFRDALQKGSKKVIDLLIDFSSIQSLHRACLEVFSKQSFSVSFPFLEKDLHSKNLNIRLLAISILSHNPTKNAINILIESSKDPEEKIRKQSILGLSNLVSDRGVKRLQEIVLDNFDSRKNRVEAARALQKMGKIEILENQKKKNPEAFEIVNYILQLGSS